MIWQNHMAANRDIVIEVSASGELHERNVHFRRGQQRTSPIRAKGYEINRCVDGETVEPGRQSGETTHRKSSYHRTQVVTVALWATWTRRANRPGPNIPRFAQRSGYRLALGHDAILFLL